MTGFEFTSLFHYLHRNECIGKKSVIVLLFYTNHGKENISQSLKNEAKGPRN